MQTHFEATVASTFQNILVKGEIAYSRQFLFPQYVQLYSMIKTSFTNISMFSKISAADLMYVVVSLTATLMA